MERITRYISTSIQNSAQCPWSFWILVPSVSLIVIVPPQNGTTPEFKTMANPPASGKKGNSGFVARKLTEALSSFLEVDESTVESRLLNPKQSRICA